MSTHFSLLSSLSCVFSLNMWCKDKSLFLQHGLLSATYQLSLKIQHQFPFQISSQLSKEHCRQGPIILKNLYKHSYNKLQCNHKILDCIELWGGVFRKPKSILSESVNGLSKYLINNVHPNAACSYNHESSCHWNDIVNIS